jgi:formate hydrogenlyase subunit 3/multisubunit Na+/H+ antiporter MnhD subunit
MGYKAFSAMSPQDAFLCAAGCLALGAVILLFPAKRRAFPVMVSFVSNMASLFFIIYAAVFIKFMGLVPARPLFSLPLLKAAFQMRLDGTAVFFLLLFSLLGLAVSWYYLENSDGFPEEVFRRHHPAVNFLLLFMFFCVSLRDMLFFLVCWDAAVISFHLLFFPAAERRQAESRRFLLVELAAFLLLLAALVPLALFSGGWSFELLQAGIGKLAVRMPGALFVIMAVFLTVFGGRAWAVSLYFPGEEKESFASSADLALAYCGFSVMGLYGLVRMFPGMLLFLKPAFFWGWALAFLGLFLLVLACFDAFSAKDFNCLLSRLSRAQTGLIITGLGTAVAFLRIDPVVSSLSLSSAFILLPLHVASAAVLFLSGGSSLFRDRRAVYGTAIMAVALLSAAGLPLLGGYAGRWLFIQAGFLGGIEVSLCLALAIGVLFSSILVPACLVRSIYLIGKTPGKSGVGRGASPAGGFSRALPALLCLVFFLFPVFALRLASLGMTGLFPGGFLPSFRSVFGNSAWLVSLAGGGEWSPLLMNAIWIFLAGLACFIFRLGEPACVKLPLGAGRRADEGN